MSFLKEIKYAYTSANIVEKIIYVNVFCFLIASIFKTLADTWLGLPPTFESLLAKPWTLISYGFTHLRMPHMLSNLLVMYYIGNLFLSYMSVKHFVNFYFLGIIIGALGFIFYHEFLNTEFANQTPEILIGASAGVSAIFIGMVAKMPNYELKLRFIGSVKLWVLAVIWLGLNLLQLANAYKGNAISHLSGATFGFIYMSQLKLGNDIGKWFEDLLNFFANLFKQKKSKSHLKTVYKSKRWKASDQEKPKQQKINEILDKISKSGYEKLSEEEKSYLFRHRKN
jgi:membrane associated rhomboid family serine protease